MTDKTAWSDAEKTIAVYFCSRHVNMRSLRCLLLRRGFDRSENAIERKLRAIVDENPHLGTSINLWDASAVDRWIDDLLGDPESVNNLIKISAEDAEIVANVSHMSRKLSRFDSRLCSFEEEPIVNRYSEGIETAEPSL